MSSEETKTVNDLIAQGTWKADPKQKFKPSSLVDLKGNPLTFGVQDPDAIGPDHNPSFEPRPRDKYPDIPASVIEAEVQYILPMAQHLASIIGVTPIDEHMYKRVTSEIKSRSLMVILNLYKTQVSNGFARWFGLMVMCRQHPVAMVQFQQRLSDKSIGVSQLRLWSREKNMYLVYGDKEGKKMMTRENTTSYILNYLRDTGILNV